MVKLTDTEREAGIVYKPIAKLPSALFTHPSTNVKGLTAVQLVDIYEGRIALGPAPAGGLQVEIRLPACG